MSPIEIIALIGAIIVLLKCVLLIVRPRGLFELGAQLLKSPEGLRGVYLVLAIVTAYFLLQQIDIVALFAMLVFSSLIFKAMMMSYPKGIAVMYKEAQQHVPWTWVLLMAAVSIWVLTRLF